jgi:glutathione S-transferase kappa 1
MVITRGDGSKSRWFGSDRFEQMAAWLGKEYKGPFADGTVAKV